MKKIVIFILAFAFLAGSSTFAVTKTKYKAFTPTGAEKGLFLKSKNSQHKYFIVNKGMSFGFDIVGPTKVKIRTRAAMKAGVNQASYEIQVWEGDKLIKGRKASAKGSSITADGESNGIGYARTLVISVPKGKHSYRLWMTSENTDKLYARFYQAKKPAKKVKYSNFKPSEFTKSVTMKSGKNSILYYKVNSQGGVKVTIAGPAKLQILCRTSFDKNMKGRAKYSFGMFEGTEMVKQFSGVARAYSKVNFVEDGGLIPSYLYKFNYSVPSGKHTYEFKMLDSASPYLALRFKINNSSLGMAK